METIICGDGEKIVLADDWEDKVNAICKEVLKEIKPTAEDTAKLIVSIAPVVEAIDEGLGKDVKIQICGSVGKNTNLR